MINERTLDLINADIDGELTSEESQELDSILEVSAEARAMRSELLKLGNMLDAVPRQSPPPDLSEKIINQLAPPRPLAKFSLSNLFASFQPATAGMAFAAGLLLTVAFYEMSPGQSSPYDAASMVGTMVGGQNGGLNLLDNNLKFSGDGFSGSISLSENNGLYVLNFDLDTEETNEITVGLDKTGLSFGGFAEAPDHSDSLVDTVVMSGGALRVVSQGQQQFALFLRETNPDQAIAAELITIDFSNVEATLSRSEPES